MTNTELNEAVARKLGYAVGKTKSSPVREAGTIVISKNPKTVSNVDENSPLPDYCHSIEAAWEVFEAMRKLNLEYIHVSQTPEGYSVRGMTGLAEEEGMGEFDFQAKTAPMAICRAFLKLS